jgi:hypothetical protein
MMIRASVSLLILTTIAAIGCNKDQQPVSASAAASQTTPAMNAPASSAGSPASASDSELVKQAVEDHLRTNKGINMSAMDMTVDSVTVDGDRAQANATFKVKGGGATMAMVYSLERHGSGWLVLKSQPSNGEFIHPPMDKIHSGGATTVPAVSGAPDVTGFLNGQSAPKPK